MAISRKKTKRQDWPITFHVEVELCDPPRGLEELELDHLWTVATYSGVTPAQLTKLVEAVGLADSTADIEVIQHLAKGCKLIYRGRLQGCLMEVMGSMVLS
jgi:hypothetical protein